MMDYIVKIIYDRQSLVWVASNDQLGLVLENKSYECLVREIYVAAQELIMLNHMPKGRVLIDNIWTNSNKWELK